MAGDGDEFEAIKQLWTEFRHGIEEAPLETDLATHLDLGVAYLEMGLLDDAEDELKLVLKEAPMHPAACAALQLVARKRPGADDAPELLN